MRERLKNGKKAGFPAFWPFPARREKGLTINLFFADKLP
jgi:hypothetical protein